MSSPHLLENGAGNGTVKVDTHGAEYVSARDLAAMLGYGPRQWGRFKTALKRAKLSCQQAGHPVERHFKEVKQVSPRGPRRQDFHLSRLAAFRVVWAADPSHPQTARVQEVLATRGFKQFWQEQQHRDAYRIQKRKELSAIFKRVSRAAKAAGIEEVPPGDPQRDQPEKEGYRRFFNAGYEGLYRAGTEKGVEKPLDAEELHAWRGLPEGAELFDHMGAEELSLQVKLMEKTLYHLAHEGVQDPGTAIDIHHRQAKRLRAEWHKDTGYYPEQCPVEANIREITRRYEEGKKSGFPAALATYQQGFALGAPQVA